jgi:hypothetical protein
MPAPDTLIRFSRLRERLIQGGVARRHVRRMLAELSDHYEDARAQEMANGRDAATAAAAAWQRLGAEDDIAHTILCRPELRSLPARFPRTVFGAGPLLLWLATTFLSVALVIAFLKGLQAMGALPPRGAPEVMWLQSPVNALVYFYMRVLPILIGAAMAVAAARHRFALSWVMIGTGAVSLLSALATFSVTFPTAPGAPGQLSIGFGVKAEELPVTLSLAALNAVLILAAYGLSLKYRRNADVGPG